MKRTFYIKCRNYQKCDTIVERSIDNAKAVCYPCGEEEKRLYNKARYLKRKHALLRD